jgi:SM-20-related protein
VIPQNFAQELSKTGLSICENYLEGEILQRTQADFESLQSSGLFKRAGVGQGSSKELSDEIRRDEIHWLERGNSNLLQAELWKKLDLLKEVLNRNLFLGLTEFEGHYAHYPAGGFYKKHLDAFRNDNARVVSFICYLNSNWKESDGGQLRIYKGDTYTDVAPRGGTMLCFMSQESEHEVLESFAPRLSFVGWFKR